MARPGRNARATNRERQRPQQQQQAQGRTVGRSGSGSGEVENNPGLNFGGPAPGDGAASGSRTHMLSPLEAGLPSSLRRANGTTAGGSLLTSPHRRSGGPPAGEADASAAGSFVSQALPWGLADVVLSYVESVDACLQDRLSVPRRVSPDGQLHHQTLVDPQFRFQPFNYTTFDGAFFFVRRVFHLDEVVTWLRLAAWLVWLLAPFARSEQFIARGASPVMLETLYLLFRLMTRVGRDKSWVMCPGYLFMQRTAYADGNGPTRHGICLAQRQLDRQGGIDDRQEWERTGPTVTVNGVLYPAPREGEEHKRHILNGKGFLGYWREDRAFVFDVTPDGPHVEELGFHKFFRNSRADPQQSVVATRRTCLVELPSWCDPTSPASMAYVQQVIHQSFGSLPMPPQGVLPGLAGYMSKYSKWAFHAEVGACFLACLLLVPPALADRLTIVCFLFLLARWSSTTTQQLILAATAAVTYVGLYTFVSGRPYYRTSEAFVVFTGQYALLPRLYSRYTCALAVVGVVQMNEIKTYARARLLMRCSEFPERVRRWAYAKRVIPHFAFMIINYSINAGIAGTQHCLTYDTCVALAAWFAVVAVERAFNFPLMAVYSAAGILAMLADRLPADHQRGRGRDCAILAYLFLGLQVVLLRSGVSFQTLKLVTTLLRSGLLVSYIAAHHCGLHSRNGEPDVTQGKIMTPMGMRLPVPVRQVTNRKHRFAEARQLLFKDRDFSFVYTILGIALVATELWYNQRGAHMFLHRPLPRPGVPTSGSFWHLPTKGDLEFRTAIRNVAGAWEAFCDSQFMAALPITFLLPFVFTSMVNETPEGSEPADSGSNAIGVMVDELFQDLYIPGSSPKFPPSAMLAAWAWRRGDARARRVRTAAARLSRAVASLFAGPPQERAPEARGKSPGKGPASAGSLPAQAPAAKVAEAVAPEPSGTPPVVESPQRPPLPGPADSPTASDDDGGEDDESDAGSESESLPFTPPPAPEDLCKDEESTPSPADVSETAAPIDSLLQANDDEEQEEEDDNDSDHGADQEAEYDVPKDHAEYYSLHDDDEESGDEEEEVDVSSHHIDESDNKSDTTVNSVTPAYKDLAGGKTGSESLQQQHPPHGKSAAKKKKKAKEAPFILVDPAKKKQKKKDKSHLTTLGTSGVFPPPSSILPPPAYSASKAATATPVSRAPVGSTPQQHQQQQQHAAVPGAPRLSLTGLAAPNYTAAVANKAPPLPIGEDKSAAAFSVPLPRSAQGPGDDAAACSRPPTPPAAAAGMPAPSDLSTPKKPGSSAATSLAESPAHGASPPAKKGKRERERDRKDLERARQRELEAEAATRQVSETAAVAMAPTVPTPAATNRDAVTRLFAAFASRLSDATAGASSTPTSSPAHHAHADVDVVTTVTSVPHSPAAQQRTPGLSAGGAAAAAARIPTFSVGRQPPLLAGLDVSREPSTAEADTGLVDLEQLIWGLQMDEEDEDEGGGNKTFNDTAAISAPTEHAARTGAFSPDALYGYPFFSGGGGGFAATTAAATAAWDSSPEDGGFVWTVQDGGSAGRSDQDLFAALVAPPPGESGPASPYCAAKRSNGGSSGSITSPAPMVAPSRSSHDRPPKGHRSSRRQAAQETRSSGVSSPLPERSQDQTPLLMPAFHTSMELLSPVQHHQLPPVAYPPPGGPHMYLPAEFTAQLQQQPRYVLLPQSPQQQQVVAGGGGQPQYIFVPAPQSPNSPAPMYHLPPQMPPQQQQQQPGPMVLVRFPDGRTMAIPASSLRQPAAPPIMFPSFNTQ